MAGFDESILEVIREGCRRSADVLVPLIVEELAPRTAVDVGCGEGWWTMALARQGVDAIGIDHPGTPIAPSVPFAPADLEDGIGMEGRTFDLALCLEVAEHVSRRRADALVAELCGLAPVVVFSAAIPGQGGHGHVNEAWPGEWVTRFARNGYSASGALRWRIWEDERVEPWYRQNLLVFARAPQRLPRLFDTELARPWAVAHPSIFEARAT